MRTQIKTLLLLFLLGIGIEGCKKDREPLPTNQLKANAGADQQVAIQ
jgi:hypothetical protein